MTTPHRAPVRAVGALVFALVAGAAGAAADVAAPEGFRVESSEELAPGLDHLTLVSERDPQVVHVARVAPGAGVRIRAVPSGDRVGRPLERTSTMCRRVGCLVGVNGDFTLPGTTLPVGGVISAGEILKSPNPSHHQLTMARDGSLGADHMTLTGKLVTTDLEELVVDGVNTPRDEGTLIVFTRSFGRSTGTNRFGAELVVRLVETEGRLRLGQTLLVELLELHDGQGDAPIPEGGAVLSGHGAAADALRATWARVGTGELGRRALLRLDSTPAAWESVGGTPILLRGGRRWFDDPGSSFARARHPRTIVGWNGDGEVFLVTVDGRQPGLSEGVTLAEAADLMADLGASEAINLDGGGSTTFTVRGEVVNRPSDRLVERDGRHLVVPVPAAGDTVVGHVERPRTTGLAVVPIGGAGVPDTDPLASGGLDLPRVLPPLPVPEGVDPASYPDGSLPALVALSPAPLVPPGWVAMAVAANLAAALGLTVVFRRRVPVGIVSRWSRPRDGP